MKIMYSGLERLHYIQSYLLELHNEEEIYRNISFGISGFVMLK
jgi:hypothetical protein